MQVISEMQARGFKPQRMGGGIFAWAQSLVDGRQMLVCAHDGCLLAPVEDPVWWVSWWRGTEDLGGCGPLTLQDAFAAMPA